MNCLRRGRIYKSIWMVIRIIIYIIIFLMKKRRGGGGRGGGEGLEDESSEKW